MTLLIIYFLIAILLSFLCSLLEAVILSSTAAHIAVMEQSGNKAGARLRKMKENINHPLSAILTVNTVANTVGAAGVGAQALKVFGSNWVAFFSALLTFCILVFSEIIPKTVGAVYWKRLVPVAVYPTQVLIVITYPFVLAFEALARVIARRREVPTVTREELLVSAEMTKVGGQLLDRERRVIRNLLRLNDVQARDVLTPRSVLFALSADDSVAEVLRANSPIRFSRIPVYGENLDDIKGKVHRFKLHQELNQGRGDRLVGELVTPLHIVPDSKSVSDVLFDFINRKEHIFQVVDEYGGTAGIITLEDAIETLLGVEIVDELDSVADMRQYARQQWAQKKKMWEDGSS